MITEYDNGNNDGGFKIGYRGDKGNCECYNMYNFGNI